MSCIAENIRYIKSDLPTQVRLVCVSKYHPVDSLQQAYDAGQRVFGESKVQELVDKHAALPKDIEWHFIGHLQTNKVKMIVPFVSLIHGVDSIKLLSEIDKQAAKAGVVVNCLLQLHIAEEDTKFGFSRDELLDAYEDLVFDEFENVRICGLMGMATNTDDVSQLEHEFSILKQIFDSVKEYYYAQFDYFKELSMGMSGDYKIAIEQGSTLIRIGSAIFGPRLY